MTSCKAARTRTIAALCFIGAVFIPSAFGCSAVACIDRGPEFFPRFVLKVEHDRQPISGALVTVTAYEREEVRTRFSGQTRVNGTVSVAVPPGDYWITVKWFGIDAVNRCFHVSQSPTRHARSRIRYELGEYAAVTTRVAGRIVDSWSSSGDAPTENLLRRANTPIIGAKVTLRDPFRGTVIAVQSDSSGAFAFDGVAEGLYILSAEGGRSTREFDRTDQPVRIARQARNGAVLLTRTDPSGGGCGGTVLTVHNH
jgi:hypothetical protein